MAAAIGEGLSLEIASRRTRDVILLDTFDWRMHAEGEEMYLEAGVLVWRGAAGEDRARIALEGGQPGFVWDLPEGSFRAALEPILEMRRLLPVARLQLAETSLSFLDHNQKTVTRGLIETRHPRSGEALPSRLWLRGIRGYGQQFASVVGAVEAGLALEPCRGRPLSRSAMLWDSGRGGIATSSIYICIGPCERTPR